MNDNLEKIKNRIRALSEKTVANGCTEAEALAAMVMAGNLLQQYNLSLDDIEVAKEECDWLTINIGQSQRNPQYWIVKNLAKFCDCRVFMRRGAQTSGWTAKKAPTTISYVFYGHKTDLLIVKYLYDVISSALEYELAQFKKSAVYRRSDERRTLSTSFGLGMATRLSDRFEEMNDAKNPIFTSSGSSIVALKNAIFDKTLMLNLKKSTTKMTVKDANAYYAGMAAGDRVALSSAVGSSASNNLKIAC